MSLTLTPQPTIINTATVTAHLLGLGAQDWDNIIQTLMLIGSDLGSDDNTTHFNAIGLDFTPTSTNPMPTPSPWLTSLTLLALVNKPLHHTFDPPLAPLPLSIVEDNN
ncbi:hypothetical protein EDB83DRAFT_2513680 [Lactarius deliciosus]|nr:hypothetical protein EDB83DRAFT_2513680 [Lactarius deliciosus]